MAEPIYDGQNSFLGGQDASKSPQFVSENGYFSGINVSNEDGTLHPRWPLVRLPDFQFEKGGVKQFNGRTKAFKDIFHSGKYQALIPYSVGTEYYLCVVVLGQIFLVNQRTYLVTHVPLEGQQMNPYAPRVNWEPAGKYLILHDFPNLPVYLEGIQGKRAKRSLDQIPVSNIGAFNQNRLFVGNAGNEFVASDPIGNIATPDAPLTFEEYYTPSTGFTGQSFQLNTNYNNDPITAMGFIQAVDSSTGIGNLFVATQNAIFSYQTNLPRAQWVAGQFGSNLCFNAGIVGPRAVVNINSDLFFISGDGQIRSLSMSRDEQGKWSKTPLSREVKNWLGKPDPAILPYTFMSYFNNKIFAGAYPYRTTALGIDDELLPDYAHGGFAVLEMDNISTLTQQTNPAWAGLWTGVRPMDMCANNGRCFVIAKEGNSNQIFEFVPGANYDQSGKAKRLIKSTLYTKEYGFKSEFNQKKVKSLDLQLANIKGDFKVDVSYKSDRSPNFSPWRSWQHDAPYESCTQPFFFSGLAGHSFQRINLGTPPSTNKSNPVSCVPYQNFERMQLKLEFEAVYWELRGIRLIADINPQSETINSCKDYPALPLPLECGKEWDIGEFTLCLL